MKRWISLYVENQVGVLAKISGLFSGKAYNMTSLTVGETEDQTVSRMTIGLDSDDATFELIKKQLNRCIEVIKVIDFTAKPIRQKEILYIKVSTHDEKERTELFRMSEVFGFQIVDYGKKALLLECVQTEKKNDEIIELISGYFKDIEVVRGGSVAIEAVSIPKK